MSHRIDRMEAKVPCGGCSWCAGRPQRHRWRIEGVPPPGIVPP